MKISKRILGVSTSILLAFNMIINLGLNTTYADNIPIGSSSNIDYSNLQDGKYTVYAEMIKTDHSGYSMSNNAIEHTVILEVIDGEYYITFEFKGLSIYGQFGYLSSLSYFDEGYTYSQFGTPIGDLVSAEVLSTYDVVDQYNTIDTPYPRELRIRLVDKATVEYTPLQVFVPIMEAISNGSGTQNVLVFLDWSTLQKVDVINITELEILIVTAKSIEQGDYTDESYKTLINIIEVAEDYLNKEDATQEDIDNQIKALQTAIDNLELNQSINITDILLLKKYILDISNNVENDKNLDYNHDQNIDVLDLMSIKNRLIIS